MGGIDYEGGGMAAIVVQVYLCLAETHGVLLRQACVCVCVCDYEKNILADRINCLYTVHSTHIHTLICVYVLNAWMLIAANTVIRHKCTLSTNHV